MIRWLRALSYKGRHHWGHPWDAPPGLVWFHDGVWWTFTRRSSARVPRRFDTRSNPLDHEEVVVETWNESRERRRYAEVEY